MTKFIAVFLGIAALTACQTVQRPLIPGQLFPGSFLNIQAPNSEGWMLLDSSSQGMAFARHGVSSDESYTARVFILALPESKDSDEFVAFIRKSTEENTSPERFKSIEYNYEYTDKRGYPCVRVKSLMDDTKARTPLDKRFSSFKPIHSLVDIRSNQVVALPLTIRTAAPPLIQR